MHWDILWALLRSVFFFVYKQCADLFDSLSRLSQIFSITFIHTGPICSIQLVNIVQDLLVSLSSFWTTLNENISSFSFGLVLFQVVLV